MARRISLVEVSSRRRRTRRLLFWGGILLGILLLIGGAGWVAARSPLFIVRDVSISGATYVPQSDIRAFLDSHIGQGRVMRLFGPQNLLAWPGGFSKGQLEALPSLTSVSIHKDYLHRSVAITVTERARVGQWCFMQREFPECFWFDDAGILFMQGYPSEGNLIPVLRDHSRAPLPLGQAALPEKFLPNLLSVFNALQAMDVSVREVRLDDLGLEEVSVDTYDGPQLRFSLRFPAAPAVEAVKALEKMAPLSNLEYVDFRVENKVYYK